MKGILGIPKPDSIELHLCGSGDCPHIFPKLERSSWHNYRDQHCPMCGCRRFLEKRLVPVRRCAFASHAV
jgi:DNA-directed RNA polymerase subunit RPC12/RpoP